MINLITCAASRDQRSQMLNSQITASPLLTLESKAVSLLKGMQVTQQLGWAFRVRELPVSFIRSACQMVLTAWQLWKPPPYLYGIRIGKVASDNFSNFPKPTTWHSDPLQAAIGPVCGGEKICSLNFSFKLSFIILYKTISVNRDVYRDCALLTYLNN